MNTDNDSKNLAATRSENLKEILLNLYNLRNSIAIGIVMMDDDQKKEEACARHNSIICHAYAIASIIEAEILSAKTTG